MLTKNWFIFFKNYFASTNDNLQIKAVNTGGTEKVVYGANTHSSLFPTIKTALSSNILTDSGICFGDGDTPPTEDDYTLSGSHLTGLVSIDTKSESSIDGEDVVFTMHYTLENKGTTAVTVKEVAWVSGHRITMNNNGYFMLDRTLLDSPVTIEPGSVAKITYTRSLTIPT